MKKVAPMLLGLIVLPIVAFWISSVMEITEPGKTRTALISRTSLNPRLLDSEVTIYRFDEAITTGVWTDDALEFQVRIPEDANEVQYSIVFEKGGQFLYRGGAFGTIERNPGMYNSRVAAHAETNPEQKPSQVLEDQ